MYRVYTFAVTDHKHILKKMGLNDKEAAVYTSLLTLGQGSANSIARISGLKRPTTYVILEDLRKRGLVLKMPGVKKQMFNARSPEELVHEMKENVSEAERALPDLMNAYMKNTPHVRTIHFEGIAGMREALWYHVDMLKDKEIVAFFGSAADASGELVDLFHEWYDKLAKQNTTIRSLVPDSKDLKEFREKDALYGFLPKILPKAAYTSQTSIDITDDFVRIVMFKELQATIIENPQVAKTLREVFEMIYTKY